jgi:hypothetical protein
MSIHAALFLGCKAVSGWKRRWSARTVDKSKFDLFKPLSLDVIFHDCEIAVEIAGNKDAFARQCLRKPAV